MKVGRNELRLLGVLGVGLAIVAWRQWGPSLGAAGPSEEAPVAARVNSLPVVELRTDALAAEAGEYHAGRDPFRYGEPPPPPPPTAEELREIERRRRESEAAQRRAEEVQREYLSKPHPPEVDLTFLGSFGPRSRKIAVFSDGRNIYNAFEGDVLNRKFIVQRIGLESVDLTFVGFPDEPAKRLPVGDKGPP